MNKRIKDLEDALSTSEGIMNNLKDVFECVPILFEFEGIELDEENDSFIIAIRVKVEP